MARITRGTQLATKVTAVLGATRLELGKAGHGTISMGAARRSANAALECNRANEAGGFGESDKTSRAPAIKARSDDWRYLISKDGMNLPAATRSTPEQYRSEATPGLFHARGLLEEHIRCGGCELCLRASSSSGDTSCDRLADML